MENKEKRKRRVSILTVFIWLALIVTMSVIVIQGISKTNALENEETRTITVKVDFSEYFEREGIEEETKKVYFMDKYHYDINAVKTNNVTQESDIDGVSRYIRNEGNVGVYEIDITEEAKYIEYYSLSSIPYSIESSTSEIEYINVYGEMSYGERIKEGIDEYEVKLKALEWISIDLKNEGEGVFIGFSEILIIKNNKVIMSPSFDSDLMKYKIFVEGDFEILISKNMGTIYENGIELDTVEYYGYEYYCKKVVDSQKKSEYNFTIDDLVEINDNTYITKSAKWIDKERGIAKINLGYKSNYVENLSIRSYHASIYMDVLSEEFELSPEYYNDSKWSILEKVDENNLTGLNGYIRNGNYANIPTEVYNEFFSKDDNTYTNKKYVYVKDTKTIYWYENVIELGKKEISINVVYSGYGNESEDEIIKTNKEAKLSTYQFDNNEIYNIASPDLKYIHTNEGIIKVEKEVEEKIGENKYYVGIFENEEEEKTDKIYEIETIDGKGNRVVEIPNYNSEKEYYIYEVDSTGNKISDESIEYSSNKMEFEYIRDAKIESDKSVVSSVMSDRYENGDRNNVDTSKWHEAYTDEYGNIYYYFETDEKNSVGTGEEDYIDNVLSVNDIYQASVTISSKNVEKKENFKVEYVAEEGGSLNGELEEKVESGNTPKNIPIVKVEDGYRFVRWEVEENGERIEVIPSEYVVLKDTVFYAIFEKVEVVNVEEKPLDTSDINIFVYIVIAFIAIVGLIVGIIFVTKKAKNKK